MKNNINIVKKGADKGYGVIVWDREDYLKEAHKQVPDEEFMMRQPIIPLTLTEQFFLVLYFFNKDPKFARFYLLPKLYRRLHNVSDIPVP